MEGDVQLWEPWASGGAQGWRAGPSSWDGQGNRAGPSCHGGGGRATFLPHWAPAVQISVAFRQRL